MPLPDERSLLVAQHVFASLTTEESPTRRRGYQTLFYTRDELTNAEVQQIERRAQYHAAQEDTGKWQFYWITEDKAVVTRIVSIPEPDEFGRKGRYLAHSLILNSAEMDQLAGGPFDLMHEDYFFSTLEEALQKGDLKTGDIPGVRREVEMEWPRRALSLVQGWPTEALEGLALLIGRAHLMTEQRQFIALIGDIGQMLDTLQVVFLLASNEGRRGCSFDTWATGCEWDRNAMFWGQGFSTIQEARTQTFIETSAMHVQSADRQSGSYSSYGRWLAVALHSAPVNTVISNQDHAQTLANILESRPVDEDSLAKVGSALILDFAHANASLIEAKIAESFPPNLSSGLKMQAISQTGKTSEEKLCWLIRHHNHSVWGQAIYQFLLNDQAHSLSAADQKVIRSSNAKYFGLSLVLAMIAQDEPLRLHSLAAMNTLEYRRVVQDLQKWWRMSDWQVFAPKHINDWLELCSNTSNSADLIEGISKVAKFGNNLELEQVTAIIHRLNTETNQEIWKWLQSSRYHLPMLRAALENTLPPHLRAEKPPAPRRSIFSRGVILAIVGCVLVVAGLGYYFLRWPSFSTKTASLNHDVKLHSKPGSNEASLKKLPKGTQVMMLGERQVVAETSWVKIRIKGSPQEGWIKEGDWLQSPSEPTEELSMPTASPPPTASPSQSPPVVSMKSPSAKRVKPREQALSKKKSAKKQTKSNKEKKPE